MRLSELHAISGGSIEPFGSDPELTGATADSRAVRPGDLFVALRGANVDGHAFLSDAVARGARALLVADPAAAPAGCPRIVVPDPYAASVRIAAPANGNPAEGLVTIGVTGTNGKTTTTYMVESILRAAGKSVGVVGTIEYRYAGKVLPAPNTSPDALALARLLADMKAAGVTHVVMEVSSHAIKLGRVAGVPFDAVGFTNLTVEHTDFHPSMEDYFLTKARLFGRDGRRAKRATVNADCGYGYRLACSPAIETVPFSIVPEGGTPDAVAARGLVARDLEPSRDGIAFTAAGPGFPARRLSLKLRGRFNVQNALLALGLSLQAGATAEEAARGLESLGRVPGRFERVDHPAPFDVVVDYAHTPDGLENLLCAARTETRGRVIAVFGCGGDRSREKRPVMGRVVGRLADIAVVTSDNPRTEDPHAILADILPGLSAVTDRYLVEPDRREAIRRALRMAGPGDLVVVAGKGHEDYQIVGRTKHPFDDRTVALELLRGMPGADPAPAAPAGFPFYY